MNEAAMKIRRVCSYTTAKAHSAARNRRDMLRVAVDDAEAMALGGAGF